MFHFSAESAKSRLHFSVAAVVAGLTLSHVASCFIARSTSIYFRDFETRIMTVLMMYVYIACDTVASTDSACRRFR